MSLLEIRPSSLSFSVLFQFFFSSFSALFLVLILLANISKPIMSGGTIISSIRQQNHDPAVDLGTSSDIVGSFGRCSAVTGGHSNTGLVAPQQRPPQKEVSDNVVVCGDQSSSPQKRQQKQSPSMLSSISSTFHTEPDHEPRETQGESGCDDNDHDHDHDMKDSSDSSDSISSDTPAQLETSTTMPTISNSQAMAVTKNTPPKHTANATLPSNFNSGTNDSSVSSMGLVTAPAKLPTPPPQTPQIDLQSSAAHVARNHPSSTLTAPSQPLSFNLPASVAGSNHHSVATSTSTHISTSASASASTTPIDVETNPDYIALTSALSLLINQRSVACNDLIQLKKLKTEALGNPEKFLAGLRRSGGKLAGAPKMQRIVRAPIVLWKSYGIENVHLDHQLARGLVDRQPVLTPIRLFDDK